ncbi:MAG: hypothetical protein ABR953_01505 [Candidatus Acidiferrales bacterium]|jgi:hypothetical protein
MPDEKKLDRFKPIQPAIPGVSPGGEKKESPAPPMQQHSGAPQAPAGQLPPTKIAVVIVGVVIVLGGLFYWSRSSSRKSKLPASDAVVAASPAVAEKPEPAEKFAVGPGPVGTTDELAKAWSSKRFLFRDPLVPKPVPAMVVRLPGGQYWGFSLREPFGDCELEYVTDLKRIASDYHFEADHPMVVNPCSRAVYDLMRYSDGALNGGIVRGDIVAGIGVRPPMAIEIRTEGKDVVAVRTE